MTRANRFFRSGILMTLVGLAMRTAAMFLGAFVSQTVGAEGMGLYTLIMTVYSFAITLATSGINLTVTRLVASAIGEGRPDEVGRVLRGSFLFSFAFGLLATLGLFFGADILAASVLSDIRTVSSLRILSLSLIPASLCAAFAGYFVGVKRVGFNATASVFCQVIKIALTVFIVTRLSAKGTISAVIGLCLVITLTEFLGFLLVFLEFIFDWRKNGKKTSNKTPEIAAVAATAMPLAFSAYVRSILLNIEHILIPKKLRESGESHSNAYSHYGTLHGMALPMIIYPMAPLSSFAGLLVPEFAEDMAAGRKKRMNRIASDALNATLCYAVISAVFMYMFSEELGLLVYKSGEAGYYISVLSLAIPIMYLDHVTDSMLKGIGEQLFSMWINITDSLLSVILVWILIPKMGIMGYALVIIIMEGYNFLLSFIRLRRRIDFKITMLRSVAFPLLSAVLSTKLACEIFRFSGSGVTAFWLVMKILFSASITLFAVAICYAIKDVYVRKLNRQTK